MATAPIQRAYTDHLGPGDRWLAGLGFPQVARIQHDTVAAIEKAGGRVYYDWQVKNSNIIPSAKLPAPEWLVNRVGIDYFGNVVMVLMGGESGTGERGSYAELVHVADLSRLEYLNLVGTAATDAGLANLKRLTRLETLWLDETRVGDSGLEHLERLTSLKRLSVAHSQVSDASLAQPEGVTSLQILNLTNTKVTDAGVQDLQESLPKLKIIH